MRLKDTPIRRKLVLLLMLTSVVVMLLMRGTFFTSELIALRQGMTQQLSTLAGILAANSTAALAFENEQDAGDILSSLRTMPHVTTAALYDAGGRLFARHPVDVADSALPAAPGQDGPAYVGTRLAVFQSVEHDGKRLGTLYVSFDTGPIVSVWLWNSLKVGLAVMAVVFLIAYALSRALQKQISTPILALAQTARTISEGTDYSVRATKLGDDETGHLTDAFNRMLAKIQSQNDALQENEARLRSIVENLSEGLAVSDLTGQLLHFNRAALDLHGFSDLAECRRHLSQFAEIFELSTLDGAVLPTEQWPLARVLRGEPLRNWEVRIRRLNTDWRRVFNYGGALVRDARGWPTLAIVTIADITERKQAEEKVLGLNLQLEQRVRERTAQLEEANQELESFSYSVSHDLRAPLRHIQGYADMLARATNGNLPEKAQRYLRVINDASIDMGRLIDDLLSFSRMGRSALSKDVVDLNTLVAQVRAVEEPAVRDRSIEWIIPALPRVRADAAMLKVALANLLGNAIKYSRPRSPARIEVGCAGHESGRAILFVRDNGVGFDMAYQDKLFGVFQRLHSQEEFEGTGIGLANVRRVITRHGGRVWAESTLNQGATFFFTLEAIEQPESGGSTS